MNINNTKNIAPQPTGTYSKALRDPNYNIVYVSIQLPLDPKTMTLVQGDITNHIHQAFKNLSAVAKEIGETMSAITKLTVYLTDLAYLPTVNNIMLEYFNPPYPARSVIQVAGLPKQASIGVEAIISLNTK